MTIDPQALRTAIHAQDGAAVRELLRHATEDDRRATAKALKDLLTEPPFPLGQPIMFFTGTALRPRPRS